MSLQLEDIRTFLAVVEEGGVNAAARRLDIARSAVSRRIASLEAALGAALFVRSSAHLTPTEDALAFYARAERLLLELEDAANDLRPADAGLSGSLRVAAPVSFTLAVLSDALIDFARAHPDLRLAIDMDDRRVDLAADGYDVGVRIGRLADSALKARRLGVSRRVLCAAPSLLDARGRPELPEDLQRLPTIGYANAPARQHWRFHRKDDKDEEVGVDVAPRLVVNNGEAIRDAAIAGLGAVALPHFIVGEAVLAGRLEAILPGWTPLSAGVYAIYPPGRETSTKVRAFIDWLAARLKDHPGLA
ncbi:MAG: LysR family transcriptional regulator [Pseudomonadota bacterium]